MPNKISKLTEAVELAESIKSVALERAKDSLNDEFGSILKEKLDALLEKESLEDETMDEMKDTSMEEGSYSKDKMEEMEDETMDEMKNTSMGESIDEAEDELDIEDEAEADLDMEATDDLEDEDDIDIDLDDLTEEDLEAFVEDVIKSMVAKGDLQAGDEGDEIADDIDDLDAATDDLEGGDLGMEPDLEPAGDLDDTAGLDDGEDEIMELAALRKKLREERAINAKLTEAISEVNLVNSKLLYINKVFKNHNLSEDRKLRVVKAFDKATNLNEAKLIYNTLTEGLNASPIAVKPKAKGVASKVTRTTKPAVIKESTEADKQFARMRKLAGLE